MNEISKHPVSRKWLNINSLESPERAHSVAQGNRPALIECHIKK